jgi:hypothetical protein
MSPRQSDSGAPTRGVSRYIELLARIEAQLEQWEVEFDAVPVAPTDKVRTLLGYAREELRGRDRQRVESVMMKRD